MTDVANGFNDDMEPMYDVGDRVIVSNPIDFFAEEDTKVHVVTDVKYSEKHGVFAYKLDGGVVWINESWLEPDIFGPQFIDDTDEEPSVAKLGLEAERDYMLISLYDAMLTQNETEIERSKARLKEIQTELEAIK